MSEFPQLLKEAVGKAHPGLADAEDTGIDLLIDCYTQLNREKPVVLRVEDHGTTIAVSEEFAPGTYAEVTVTLKTMGDFFEKLVEVWETGAREDTYKRAHFENRMCRIGAHLIYQRLLYRKQPSITLRFTQDGRISDIPESWQYSTMQVQRHNPEAERAYVKKYMAVARTRGRDDTLMMRRHRNGDGWTVKWVQYSKVQDAEIFRRNQWGRECWSWRYTHEYSARSHISGCFHEGIPQVDVPES